MIILNEPWPDEPMRGLRDSLMCLPGRCCRSAAAFSIRRTRGIVFGLQFYCIALACFSFDSVPVLLVAYTMLSSFS